MDFRLRLAAILFVGIGLTTAQIPSARTILNIPETEQARFVAETMDAGFPGDRADQMTMLVLNRSALVLPMLEQRVEAELRRQSPSNDFIETATEMIAYAGNDQSLRMITRLTKIDEGRFERLVGRTLDNALDFRNPFTVVYSAFEIGDATISQRTLTWSESALSSERMKRLWGEAILDRYGEVPGDREWSRDPLASRLKKTRLEQLRQDVSRFAAEALARRRQK